jgi:hypothetical protein
VSYLTHLPSTTAMSGKAMATTDRANDKENKMMTTSPQRLDKPHAEVVPEEHLDAENDGFISRATNIAVSSTLTSQNILNLVQSSVALAMTVSLSGNQVRY